MRKVRFGVLVEERIATSGRERFEAAIRSQRFRFPRYERELETPGG